MSMMTNGKTVVSGNRVWINNEELPPCPSKGHNITMIDGNVYIDGYEYKDGRWKRTLKALWYKWFC